VEVVCWRGDVDHCPVGSLRLALAADDGGELVLIVVAHLETHTGVSRYIYIDIYIYICSFAVTRYSFASKLSSTSPSSF